MVCALLLPALIYDALKLDINTIRVEAIVYASTRLYTLHMHLQTGLLLLLLF